MKHLILALSSLLWLSVGFGTAVAYGADQAADGPLAVRASLEKDGIVVRVGGQVFTVYRFGDDLKYPHFYPVNGPLTGQSVTAVNTEPWPHHSSLFLSCDRVSGANYWQPFTDLKTGQITATAPRVVESTGQKVVLSDVAQWAKPGEEPQLRDTRTITITAPSAKVRVLDFQFDFHILQDLHIQKTGHSLFSARMNPTIAVDGGGLLIDSDGNRNEEGTRGKSASWCAYYGQHHGQVEGLAIMQHSSNPHSPAPWFNRNYGFFSPTPVWLEDRHLNAGDQFTMRYRVVVFAGDHEQAQIAELYDEFERLYPQ
jgi:hypothetical protein